MRSPLADSERDRLIAAILPDVAFDGWSQHALRLAAGRIGVPVGEAMALFPRGALDDPQSKLHLYGKSRVRPGRKMGHITRLLPRS